MPAAIAIPLAIGAGTAAAGIGGAALSSSAAKDAAQKQTDAANHAADVQAKSAADTLAFQKQSAENDYRNQEATRRANFDQWASGMGAKNNVRAALGLGRVVVPSYVPSVDPNYGGDPTQNTIAGGPSVTSSAIPPNSIRAQQLRAQQQGAR
jgi:hypothetical protein